MTLDRHRISRERILEGANDILDSGDYADLTVDALARSLRMSKSTLYKYFSSKEDVIVALVRDVCDEAERELDEILGRGAAPAQLTELAAIIGRHGQRLPRAALVDLHRVPRTCIDRIRQTRKAFVSAAVKVLERGVSRREFSHAEPALAATAFAAACEAVLVDGAKSGIPEYGARVALVPGLFLPALVRG
jgi:AcrR family transcriptional regulator